MQSLLVNDAAEYNAATDRINSALQVLRDEMKSLRHQDVTLMSQFITMNDKIRSLSKGQKSREKCNKRSVVISQKSQTTPSRPISEMRKRRLTRCCDVIPEEREQNSPTTSDDESDASSLSGSVTSLTNGASFWGYRRNSSSDSDDSDSPFGADSEEESL